MNSAFTVDEIAESFWTEQTVAMNHHSHSEWAFERLMQEVSRGPISPSSSATCDRIAPAKLSDSKSAKVGKNEIGEHQLDQSSKVPVGSDDHALLKAKFHRACAAAAAARSWSQASKPGESGVLPEGQLPVTKPVQLGSQADGPVRVMSTVHSASDSAPRGIAALSSTQRNAGIQVKQTTSDSSREDSEDDEVEGDTGTTNDPAEVKRARRMQSNKESARRSRRRKQDQMNELETQVGQLKVEHTSLLKRLTDINSKFDNASVDNRILIADIDNLRTKVKMAEETVKRVTGINPLLLAMSNLHGTGSNSMLPFMGNPVDTFAMPGQQQPPLPPNPNNHFFHLQPSFPHNPSLDIGTLQQNEGGGGPNSMPLPSIPVLSSNRKPQ